ncbi:MAG: hypothetical protein HFF22_08860 [Oscillospiraceae bacterium]|jgi:hypothetical protein|nr:hypothetical protein [Oscillospiraceae bacterium]
MEDRKRTVLAAVIILVVLAAVLYSFSMNLFGPTPELVLPDPDATASTGPSAEPSGGRGGVLVEVSPQTVQSLIASLSRYESYSRTAAVEYFDGGQSVGTASARVWADGGWIRTDVTLASGRVEHAILGDGRLWLWYDRESTVYQGPAEDLSADLIQRVPTYEDVLALDKQSISAAGYVERDGLPCVYVEARSPELGYVERYWISETSGLLMAAETEKDGELVYTMSSQEVVSPLDQAAGVFVLPDGTQLYAPER